MTLNTHVLGARVVLVASAIINGCGALLCMRGGYWDLVVGWSMCQFGVAHVWDTCVGVLGNWVSAHEQGRAIGIL
jgi:sugar phosphate permease